MPPLMQKTQVTGVYKKGDKVYTKTPAHAKGIYVYNEKLYTYKGMEYRSWNPYRSKFAAALKKGISIEILPHFHILYLGAAMGTTVSHIADIAIDGIVYAVEHTPLAMSNLLKVSAVRTNIVPILEDAYHPDRYSTSVGPVDIIYQDISQRNQADIFVSNSRRYLKKEGLGILMVKARSIDVALKPQDAYKIVADTLQQAGIHIFNMRDLSPFDKDHAVILARMKR